MIDAPFRKWLYRPFTAITRVRIPSGTPTKQTTYCKSPLTAKDVGNAVGMIGAENAPIRPAVLWLLNAIGIASTAWQLSQFTLHPAGPWTVTIDALALLSCAFTVSALVSQFARVDYWPLLKRCLAGYGMILLALALVLWLTGCGGMSLPGVPAGARVPPGPVNAPFNPFFNSSMIGRTDTFSDGAGCFTFFHYSKMPPSDFFPPDSIIMTITKSAPQCYWAGGVSGASIDFILSPLPDGSFRSMGWVFHAPDGIPAFWSCRNDPCTQEIQTSAGNSVFPYMIIPPADLAPGESRTFGPTAYDLYNAPGINFNYFVSDSALHARNQFWLTRFTRSADGHSVRVEQWEGTCGHEIWTLQDGSQGPNGPSMIESPNDGPPSAPCSPPLTIATISRVG